eukprot:5078989-Alexandrium_andersonii.AAC.1
MHGSTSSTNSTRPKWTLWAALTSAVHAWVELLCPTRPPRSGFAPVPPESVRGGSGGHSWCRC